MDPTYRFAAPSDQTFLERMLFEAAYWRPGIERPALRETFEDPELGKLLRDWGRDGDAGVVAVDSTGSTVGAAWYRFWTDDDHSYGFVDAATPEVAIGVEATHRGRGVGSGLLDALIAYARSASVSQLSSSVEKDNPARRLYERKGFETVGSVGNAWTMVLLL